MTRSHDAPTMSATASAVRDAGRILYGRHVDCASSRPRGSSPWSPRWAMAELRTLDWIRRRVPGVRCRLLVPPPSWATHRSYGQRSARPRCSPVPGPVGGCRCSGPVCTLAAASATRHALAEVIDRPRPPNRLWRASWSGPSFPSRHTTLGTVGAGLVARLLTPGPRAHVVVGPVAAAVGVSRLVLGVHWPSDVVGGWVFVAATLAPTHRGVSVPGGDVAVGR
jgi:hypothetical protein